METIIWIQKRYTDSEIKTMFYQLSREDLYPEIPDRYNAALMLIQLFEDREKLINATVEKKLLSCGCREKFFDDLLGEIRQ